MTARTNQPPIERVDSSISIGQRWLRYSSVTSTNTIAAQLAEDVANHGVVITAEAQSEGRGQYERRWTTPPGSAILMSVILHPPTELRRASILTAWAAVAACETIHNVAGLEAVIKWPNDVLVGGRKVCGILCEGGARHIIAGIGLNVNQTVEDLERLQLPAATSLAIAGGSHFQLVDVTEDLIRQLDDQYARLMQYEIAGLEANWKARIGLVGEDVVIERTDESLLAGCLLDMGFSAVKVETTSGAITTMPPEAIRHLLRAEAS
jgi:BirA family transcriptional regulator, biotin operon repressor / biotin---[acetyl-CoA-carboxylase] ligase